MVILKNGCVLWWYRNYSFLLGELKKHHIQRNKSTLSTFLSAFFLNWIFNSISNSSFKYKEASFILELDNFEGPFHAYSMILRVYYAINNHTGLCRSPVLNCNYFLLWHTSVKDKLEKLPADKSNESRTISTFKGCWPQLVIVGFLGPLENYLLNKTQHHD